MSEKPTYEELEQRVQELEQAESKRKIIEETSKNTSELLSFFIKHSPIYAFLKKVSHKESMVLYASDNYIDMIGVPASQMVGKTMHELFPKEFAEKITHDDIFVINQGNNLVLDEELNGRNYVTYKFPLMQDGNKYLAGYTVDITDLKRTEGELAQIFAMSLDMICIADINTATFIKVNPAFTEILGYSEEELIGKPIFDFIHPDDIDETLTIIDQKLQKGAKVIDFENRYRCKDGNYRWLSWVSHPDTEKGVTFAVARDITGRKQNEEALKTSKALLDATGRMARVGGWELDVSTMDLTWTEETYRIHEVPLNHKPPPLQEAINFFHPEDRPKLEQAIQRALDHGEPYDLEIRFINTKEKHLWTRTKCDPKMVDGKVVTLKGTFQDITERKQAEEALQESRQKFKSIVENIRIGVALVSPKMEVIELNRQMREWFPDVEPGNGLISCQAFNDSPLGRICQYCPTCKTLQDGKVHESITSTPQGGKIRNFRIVSSPIFNEQDEVTAAIEMVEDITERIKLDNQLRNNQKLEAIGNLAGGIAHDFNNILSSILGFTELSLEDVEKGTSIEGNLQEVYTAGKRAKDLVRQILAFSRQADEELKPIRVQPIVKEVLKFIRASIPTTIQIKPSIESESLIMGDATQIHQVLMNLCTNAAFAMEDKVGILEVALNDFTVDGTASGKNLDLPVGDYIEIRVSDTGAGIKPEIIDKIFEPYFTTKDLGEGTGLGLSMVHGIVESYGGRISVDSTWGQGTTFTIYLPVARGPRIHLPDELEILPSGIEHILFIDDEIPIAKMGGQILERLGYSVTTRTSSYEALELFKSKPDDFDLVVTDMTMPNMTGDKLAIELRKIRPDIPIILCTGYSKKIPEDLIAEIGIKAFIYKPIVKADLAKTVRKVLDE